MKVLLLSGSPRKEGNSYIALKEIGDELQRNGVDYKIIELGNKPVRGCIACYKCIELGRCVFEDDIYNKVFEAAKECDALVVASPVYFGGPNGSLCALLDRLFMSAGKHLQYKPAASVAVCRRGGASATFDRLNKYYLMTNMLVIGSQYWNSVHGRTQGEAMQDEEGLQTMRTLARNMVWTLNSINGKELPKKEAKIATNFIR